MKLTRGRSLSLLVVLLLILDQVVKILVKTHMKIGESIHVFGDWFQILFVENEGMAFGMSWGPTTGKYILTAFRIVFSIVLVYYIWKLNKKKVKTGVLVGLTLVFAGAVGNILDCLFYGQLFSASTYNSVATAFPEAGGYAPLMLGKVVVMLYFPIINTVWPDWMPFCGGDRFVFFSPIFNIADSYVTIAVFYLLIFERKALKQWLK